MAAHSSVLAWRIPGLGEPGGLPSMGSHRVRNDWWLSIFILLSFVFSLTTDEVVWFLMKNVSQQNRKLTVITPILEKAMAPHSSTLACKLPWTEEPGRLQSMGSRRVGHNWVTSLSLFHFPALEKEIATHSSVLAWRIPGMGEPGGLPSMGSHRVGHNWSNLA